ncbi:MAG: DUF177 domain-containing protein [Leadbetterella sp.]|nr:DUF177 domain-containing protein [Leadbetterella sp.]
MKKELSKYDILIHGLEDKNHEYEFEGADAFFQEFEQDIVEGGRFKANVLLEKNASLIRVNLDITAQLRLQCDRSLEFFEEEFSTHATHIFKFGGSTAEVSDELEVIPFGTHKINIANLLFDYILLQVPMKKLHPKFRAEDTPEEGTMVYQDPNFTEEKEEIQDPRWAALINLKNKN